MRKRRFLAVLTLAGLMITATAACGSTGDNAGSGTESSNSNGMVSESNEGTEEESSSAAVSTSAEITLEDVINAPESPEEDFDTITSADGECEIIDYYGTDEIVVIPDIINGEKVVSVGKYVFANDYTETVRAIRLADSIVSIDEGAFGNNEVLEIFVAGSGLETIGENCFLGCSSLKTVVLNEGLMEIRDSAFVMCYELSELTIPSTVEMMDDLAIYFVADDFVIYGTAGSVAESYAEENGYTFVKN